MEALPGQQLWFVHPAAVERYSDRQLYLPVDDWLSRRLGLLSKNNFRLLRLRFSCWANAVGCVLSAPSDNKLTNGGAAISESYELPELSPGVASSLHDCESSVTYSDESGDEHTAQPMGIQEAAGREERLLWTPDGKQMQQVVGVEGGLEWKAATQRNVSQRAERKAFEESESAMRAGWVGEEEDSRAVVMGEIESGIRAARLSAALGARFGRRWRGGAHRKAEERRAAERDQAVHDEMSCRQTVAAEEEVAYGAICAMEVVARESVEAELRARAISALGSKFGGKWKTAAQRNVSQRAERKAFEESESAMRAGWVGEEEDSRAVVMGEIESGIRAARLSAALGARFGQRWRGGAHRKAEERRAAEREQAVHDEMSCRQTVAAEEEVAYGAICATEVVARESVEAELRARAMAALGSKFGGKWKTATQRNVSQRAERKAFEESESAMRAGWVGEEEDSRAVVMGEIESGIRAARLSAALGARFGQRWRGGAHRKAEERRAAEQRNSLEHDEAVLRSILVSRVSDQYVVLRNSEMCSRMLIAFRRCRIELLSRRCVRCWRRVVAKGRARRRLLYLVRKYSHLWRCFVRVSTARRRIRELLAQLQRHEDGARGALVSSSRVQLWRLFAEIEFLWCCDRLQRQEASIRAARMTRCRVDAAALHVTFAVTVEETHNRAELAAVERNLSSVMRFTWNRLAVAICGLSTIGEHEAALREQLETTHMLEHSKLYGAAAVGLQLTARDRIEVAETQARQLLTQQRDADARRAVTAPVVSAEHCARQRLVDNYTDGVLYQTTIAELVVRTGIDRDESIWRRWLRRLYRCSYCTIVETEERLRVRKQQRRERSNCLRLFDETFPNTVRESAPSPIGMPAPAVTPPQATPQGKSSSLRQSANASAPHRWSDISMVASPQPQKADERRIPYHVADGVVSPRREEPSPDPYKPHSAQLTMQPHTPKLAPGHLQSSPSSHDANRNWEVGRGPAHDSPGGLPRHEKSVDTYELVAPPYCLGLFVADGVVTHGGARLPYGQVRVVSSKPPAYPSVIEGDVIRLVNSKRVATMQDFARNTEGAKHCGEPLELQLCRPMSTHPYKHYFTAVVKPRLVETGAPVHPPPYQRHTVHLQNARSASALKIGLMALVDRKGDELRDTHFLNHTDSEASSCQTLGTADFEQVDPVTSISPLLH